MSNASVATGPFDFGIGEGEEKTTDMKELEKMF